MSTRMSQDPGPVFVYEWITASRRWQVYAVRSLFVLGLLAAFLMMGMSREAVVVADPAGLRVLAQLGERLFVAVIGTQLTLVLLAAPAATAGAISLDRSRGTLTHLLVTDLSDREIVLGKLAARLVPVVTLVACTLPVLQILTLLGGVDPEALLGAFVVTLGVAVLGCCLALVFSIWVRKTHEALLATYAVWGLWLLGPSMIEQVNGASGWSLAVPPSSSDPYRLAFAPYWWPGTVDWRDYLGFLVATWGISAVLAALAVRCVRRVCLREGARTPARRPGPGTGVAAIARRPLRLLDWSGPTLDFNPVLWREWHRNRPQRWMRIVAWLFATLSLLFSVLAIDSGKTSILPAWVNGFQVSIGLLLVSVVAATSLAEERAGGSLEVLLSTPLPTWEIVVGKWLGTYRLVPLLAVLPALVVHGIMERSVERSLAAILTIAFVLSCGAAITSLGLAMATWCRRIGRSLGLTVTLYLLVTVGWLFTIVAIHNGGMPDARYLMMASPFFWAGIVVVDVSSGRFWGDNLDWAVTWILAYALTALALLAATLLTFNRCLGRLGGGFVRHGRPNDRT
jgi:ABC-type transport system involved in multi-copper enzyme maturation permease subunit